VDRIHLIQYKNRLLGFCEYGNKALGIIKCGECINKLNNARLLKSVSLVRMITCSFIPNRKSTAVFWFLGCRVA
jgi:hypothetical protein